MTSFSASSVGPSSAPPFSESVHFVVRRPSPRRPSCRPSPLPHMQHILRCILPPRPPLHPLASMSFTMSFHGVRHGVGPPRRRLQTSCSCQKSSVTSSQPLVACRRKGRSGRRRSRGRRGRRGRRGPTKRTQRTTTTRNKKKEKVQRDSALKRAEEAGRTTTTTCTDSLHTVSGLFGLLCYVFVCCISSWTGDGPTTTTMEEVDNIVLVTLRQIGWYRLQPAQSASARCAPAHLANRSRSACLRHNAAQSAPMSSR